MPSIRGAPASSTRSERRAPEAARSQPSGRSPCSSTTGRSISCAARGHGCSTRRQRLSRRLQQRPLRRARASACGRGDRQAGGAPQHPHALSARQRCLPMRSGCSRRFPTAISNIAFTCTGSESNDLALQVARAATGGTGFVVTENAYHGNSSAVVEISPSSTPGRTPPPHVRLVPPPDPRRYPRRAVSARGFAAAVSRRDRRPRGERHPLRGARLRQHLLLRRRLSPIRPACSARR